MLAWRSASLHGACRSSEVLATRWPGVGEAAMLLLSAVSHAENLGQLRRLRSVRVDPPHSNSTKVLVSLEEVQMQAVVLTLSGHRVDAAPPGQFWSRHGSAQALLVLDLTAQGLPLVRTAS